MSKKLLSNGDDGPFARSGSLFWGLKYKLSLYDSPVSASSMSVPQAKLLSQKERPLHADSPALQSQPELPLVVISALLIATICLSIYAVRLVLIWLAANEDARHRAHFRSSFFSFRPPPTPLQHN
jgi:hypothetical protein